MTLPVLWVDKYRPKTVNDYVWENEDIRRKFEEWIDRGVTDNLILYGPQGTGKTSLARILMYEIGVDPADYLVIPASKHRGIDVVRDQIEPFIRSGGFSAPVKYVLLEEASGLTPDAQDSLKEDMEEYQSTVRWIMTTNHITKIIPPLKDRCTCFSFERPNEDAFLDKLIYILEQEGVDYGYSDEVIDEVMKVMKKNYPSLRGAIRALNSQTINGKLEIRKSEAEAYHDGWKKIMVDLFKQGKIRDARDTIAANATTADFEGIYRWLYENIDLFDKPESALIVLANGYRHHPMVADPEINLSATLTEIFML